jgi:hypothetical protein
MPVNPKSHSAIRRPMVLRGTIPADNRRFASSGVIVTRSIGAWRAEAIIRQIQTYTLEPRSWKSPRHARPVRRRHGWLIHPTMSAAVTAPGSPVAMAGSDASAVSASRIEALWAACARFWRARWMVLCPHLLTQPSERPTQAIFYRVMQSVNCPRPSHGGCKRPSSDRNFIEYVSFQYLDRGLRGRCAMRKLTQKSMWVKE